MHFSPFSLPGTYWPHDWSRLAAHSEVQKEWSWLQQGDSNRLFEGLQSKSSPTWGNFPTVALSEIPILRSDTNFCPADKTSPSARKSPVCRASTLHVCMAVSRCACKVGEHC